MIWVPMVVPVLRRVMMKFARNEKLTREEKYVCLSIFVLSYNEVAALYQQTDFNRHEILV